jgi:hypothetical protein
MSTPNKWIEPMLFKYFVSVLVLSIFFGQFDCKFALAQSEKKPSEPSADHPVFESMPLGSIRPNGWLRHQLELQRSGLTGQAPLLMDGAKPNSAWRGGTGEDWEKGPYYLRGLLSLAWALNDADLKQNAKEWVDAILSSQREDGFYGPKTNDDWWPRMVVNHVLRDYADATNEERVVSFLKKYYRYMLKTLPTRPLKDWGRARAGDEVEVVLWLHQKTNENSLLELVDLLGTQAFPWTEIMSENLFVDFDDAFHTRHAVNVPQALKLPSLLATRSRSPRDLAAYRKGVAHLDRDHGLALGINSGTEFLSGNSSTQGIELCSVVERMLSDAVVARRTGDMLAMDSFERMALNVLPASMSKDIHQHVYYCLPNNAIAKLGGKGFDQDHIDANVPSPMSGFHCCCYNLHMGWPKYVQNSWAKSNKGGIALIAHGPTELRTVVDGVEVSLTSDTNYPFAESIRVVVETERAVTFPLLVRIPGWCADPVISVNGQPFSEQVVGGLIEILRKWNSTDTVSIQLPMKPRIQVGINDSVSVHRGPLTYALPIREKRVSTGQPKLPGFGAYEIYPDSYWNYALAIDPDSPASSFEVNEQVMPAQPYSSEDSPVSLAVKAKRAPQWKLARSGLVSQDPPPSPIVSNELEESIRLVPIGGTMLRITNFPVLGSRIGDSQPFNENFSSQNAIGWVTYGGSWYVRDGALHTASQSHSGGFGIMGMKAILPTKTYSNFVYSAKVATSSSGDAGIVFRVSEPSIGADNYCGYYAGISVERQQLVLGKADYGWYPLKTVDLKCNAMEPIRLTVVAKGSSIQVFVSSESSPRLEMIDDSFASGSVGVRRYSDNGVNAGSSFTNVNVEPR